MRLHAHSLLAPPGLWLAFGLLFCVPAGAADTKDAKDAKDAKPAKIVLEVRPSVYAPKSTRDPFLPAGVTLAGKTGVAAAATDFNLQGILYHPTKPSAMINNALVMLNKAISVQTSAGKLEIKAIEITRNSVKLQVGEQVVDLRLEPPKTPSPTAASKAGVPAPAASPTGLDSPPVALSKTVAAVPATSPQTTTGPVAATPKTAGP